MKSNLEIHFVELKIRMFYFFINFLLFFAISFLYKEELLFLFSYLFLQYETGFIYTNLLDPLIIYVKISFFVSLFLSFPFLIYFFSFFFFRSFNNFYVYFFYLYLTSLYMFFLCFFVCEFFLLFPLIFEFLLSFQKFDLFNLILTITLTEYLSFFINLFCVYLILCLLPSLLFLFFLLGWVQINIFFNFKLRLFLYFFLLFFFIIFAPPDFILQALIAPWLIIMLEFFIYFNLFFIILLQNYSNRSK